MSESPPTRGVLFDVGYALLDESARLHAAIEWTAIRLREHEQVPTADVLLEQYVAACERPDPAESSLFVQALHRLGLPREEARRLREELPWDAVPLSPFADAEEALRTLRDAGLRVGVLANQPASAADDLERSGLAGFCDGIWLSDAVGLRKPDPAFFRLALSIWQMPPEHVAYVGDRPDNDVAPARSLGLHTVRLRLGPHAFQQPRSGAEVPDTTVSTLNQAAAHLLKWADRRAF